MFESEGQDFLAKHLLEKKLSKSNLFYVKKMKKKLKILNLPIKQNPIFNLFQSLKLINQN